MAWLDSLFSRMVEVGASDLHMTSGRKPVLRCDGEMVTIEECESISPDQMRQILMEVTPHENQSEFEQDHDTDFAYEISGLARFRANLFEDNRGPGGVFRVIPEEILTAEQLGLPPAVVDLCGLSKGLVLVTGPTGSGKSTTLAGMIDHINATRSEHIITIEDPIEFVHADRRCLVNQREVGGHTQSFKRALRAALREDPDVILVGELRDLETIEIALETAETGHLVFGTLHTTTAASTVDRIIDQFPADRQAQIRTMLSGSLKGVVAQTLCKKEGGGRCAALETLIVTSGVASLIREGKTHQITSQMQMGGKVGMRLMNDSLAELVQTGKVSESEALHRSVDRRGLAEQLGISAGLEGTNASAGRANSQPAIQNLDTPPGTSTASPSAPLPSEASPTAQDPFERFKQMHQAPEPR